MNKLLYVANSKLKSLEHRKQLSQYEELTIKLISRDRKTIKHTFTITIRGAKK